VKLGYEADCRAYHMPVEILKALGVRKLRLISNNPEKVDAVQAAGIEVVERVPADVEIFESNIKYLRTKRDKMGHLFTHSTNRPAVLFFRLLRPDGAGVSSSRRSLHWQHLARILINAR